MILALNIFLVVAAAAALGLCLYFGVLEAAERAVQWRVFFTLYACVGLALAIVLVLSLRMFFAELDRTASTPAEERIVALLEGVHA